MPTTTRLPTTNVPMTNVPMTNVPMTNVLRRAMQNPDDLVVVLDYADAKGAVSRRVVSPIRFLGGDRFLALCLCREEPRQFHLSRCSAARLDRAANYVMPVMIEELSLTHCG